jgi:hypothetical protein
MDELTRSQPTSATAKETSNVTVNIIGALQLPKMYPISQAQIFVWHKILVSSEFTDTAETVHSVGR